MVEWQGNGAEEAECYRYGLNRPGSKAREAMIVATMFEASWKPFVKSKTTTRKTARTTRTKGSIVCGSSLYAPSPATIRPSEIASSAPSWSGCHASSVSGRLATRTTRCSSGCGTTVTPAPG
jgi:hypothetical protein